MMKAAKAQILSVGLNCPYCGGDIPNSDGSFQFEPYTVSAEHQKLICQDCGRESSAPKIVRHTRIFT